MFKFSNLLTKAFPVPESLCPPGLCLPFAAIHVTEVHLLCWSLQQSLSRVLLIPPVSLFSIPLISVFLFTLFPSLWLYSQSGPFSKSSCWTLRWPKILGAIISIPLEGHSPCSWPLPATPASTVHTGSPCTCLGSDLPRQPPLYTQDPHVCV